MRFWPSWSACWAWIHAPPRHSSGCFSDARASGSTGVGRGVAIPHSRSLVSNRLRLAYGRHPAGLEFQAIDGKPVSHFFLIVAPPLEISNQYLPVLGRIAQFAKEPDVPARLAAVTSPEEFFQLLEEKRV